MKITCGNITITYGGLSYVNQVMTYYTSGTTFESTCTPQIHIKSVRIITVIRI